MNSFCRDVKPGNFVVGRAEDGDLRKLYILDFGMCRKFVDNNVGSVVPCSPNSRSYTTAIWRRVLVIQLFQNVMLQPRKKAPFRGTPRYAPISSHMAKEHSRKDDVESWQVDSFFRTASL